MPPRWRRRKSEKKKKPDSPTNVPDGGTGEIKGERGNGAAFHDHGDVGQKDVISTKTSEPEQTKAVANGAAFHGHGDAGRDAVASPNLSESKQKDAGNPNPKMENSSNAETENSSNLNLENDRHFPSHDSISNKGQSAKDLGVQKHGREDGKLKGDAMVSDVQGFKKKSSGCPERDVRLVDGKNDGEQEEKSKILEPLKDNQQRASNGSPSNDGIAVTDSGKGTEGQSSSLTASGVTERENAVSSEVLKSELLINSPEAITETRKGESTTDDTGLPESGKGESRENADKSAVSYEVLKSELPIKSPEAIVESGKGESTANDTGLPESEKGESRDNAHKSAVSYEVLKSELPIKSAEAIVESGKGESTANSTGLHESEKGESRDNADKSAVLKSELPIKSAEAFVESGKGESTENDTGLPESEKGESRENTDKSAVSFEVLKNELPIKSPEAIVESEKGECTTKDTGLPESERGESRENADKNAVSYEVLKSELPIKSPEAIVESGKGESTANDTGLPDSEKEAREKVDNRGVLGLVEPTNEEHMEIVPVPSPVEVHHEDKEHVVIDTAYRPLEITENVYDYAHVNTVKTSSEEIPEIVPFSLPVEIDQQANKPAITVDAADKPVALSSKDSEEPKMTETEMKLPPLIERPTSWKFCCGMLDVFMGSDR